MEQNEQPDRLALVWRLSEARRELDQLVSARAIVALGEDEQARYRELCDEESRLLDALAQDVPVRRPES